MDGPDAAVLGQVVGKGAPLAAIERAPGAAGQHHHRLTVPAPVEALAVSGGPIRAGALQGPVIAGAAEALGDGAAEGRFGRFGRPRGRGDPWHGRGRKGGHRRLRRCHQAPAHLHQGHRGPDQPHPGETQQGETEAPAGAGEGLHTTHHRQRQQQRLHTGEQQKSHGTVATSLADQLPAALRR